MIRIECMTTKTSKRKFDLPNGEQEGNKTAVNGVNQLKLLNIIIYVNSLVNLTIAYAVGTPSMSPPTCQFCIHQFACLYLKSSQDQSSCGRPKISKSAPPSNNPQTMNDGKQYIRDFRSLGSSWEDSESCVSILEPRASPAELSFSHSHDSKLDNVLYFFK